MAGVGRPQRASVLLEHPGHMRLLSTGCPTVDAFLGGGIDGLGITEVAGEAGAGKTQLALQLTLQAQLPPHLGGLGGGAVYLYGDSATAEPSLRRLDQLAVAFEQRYAHVGADRERLKNNVYVLNIEDPEDLWRTIDERVPALLKCEQVRLLVLDSIGGIFRSAADECSASSARAAHGQRAQQLMQFAARLKAIANKYHIATIIINQVTDKPSDAQHRRSAAPWEIGACGTPDGSTRVPALGIAWSSCVNTRLILTRRCAHAPASDGTGAYDTTWRRHMHVAWSPRLPCSDLPFWVREQGVVGQFA